MSDEPLERVLIVEDDDLSRPLLERLVRRYGMTSRATDDGAQALEWLRQGETFALTICDVLMPRMGGARFGQQLLELLPEARVLFISGMPPEGFDELLARDGVAFLQKPFTPNELSAALDDLLA